MRVIIGLLLLTCLHAPLDAHGQERIYLVSTVGLVTEANWGHGYESFFEPSSFWSVGVFTPLPPILQLKLRIVNAERSIGPNLRPFHRYSIGLDTGYGMGLASIGRFHILTVSAGAFVSAGRGCSVWEDYCVPPWSLNAGAQFGAYLMPADFLGLGVTAHANVRTHSVRIELLVRPRWTGFGK